jgi:hypothetical protein
VTPRIRDRNSLEQWWRPGELPRPITWFVAVAATLTFAVADVGAHHFAGFFGIDGFWLRDGIALGVAVMLVAVWAVPMQTTRALRIAVALPALQLAAIVAAWTAWRVLSPHLAYAAKDAPLVNELPLGLATAGTAAATIALARLIAWKRRGEWLHACAMLSLVHLLLAGLCAPIAAQVCMHIRYQWGWDTHELAKAMHWRPLVLGLPLVLATVFTAIAIHKYEHVHRWRKHLLVVVITGIAVAVAMRAEPRVGSAQVYANYIHVLLALTIVAVGSLGVLGIATALGTRRTRRALARGPLEATVLRSGDDVVAYWEIAGWLRGPRLVSRPFTALTRAGALRVPGEIGVVASPPPVSTRLAAGDALALIREGDKIALAGFVAPPADHPFRTSAALVPGSAGIHVGRDGEPPAGFTGIALVLWRPCIAYLLVVIAIALPGLAAALSARY